MVASLSDQYPEWQHKIKLLSDSVWQEAKLNEAKIDLWLENFRGGSRPVDVERKHAFHLLQQFIFFGKQEVAECLKVLFRDHLLYPRVQELLRAGKQRAEISSELEKRLQGNTRFVGVGFPAESGHRFLYDFRITNDLPVRCFPELGEVEQTLLPSIKFRLIKLLRRVVAPIANKFFELVSHEKNACERLDAERSVPFGLRHLVFLDDFCATGEQVSDRIGSLVAKLKASQPDLSVSYYLLFATTRGLNTVRASRMFDDVQAAIVFDDDYRAFGTNSHYYKDAPPDIDSNIGRAVMHYYGSLVYPSDSLGFRDCQLLVGFEHNTPDNTLPVFWVKNDSVPWSPIFPRARKH